MARDGFGHRRRVLYPLPHTPEALRGYIRRIEEAKQTAIELDAGRIDWMTDDLVWLAARLDTAEAIQTGTVAVTRRPGRPKRPYGVIRPRSTSKRNTSKVRPRNAPPEWYFDPVYAEAMSDHAKVLRLEGESSYKIARRLGVAQAWVWRRLGR